MKTVFIAHPIAGDVENNIKKVLGICQKIHTKEIIPVAPYLVSLQYLNDNVVEDRELGKEANLECFRRKYIDELWLFGNRISLGMIQEIKIALDFKIPIFSKTPETEKELTELFDKWGIK